jgi:phosphatidylserine/phosphatidylglycerophosphate/cardiolipin synthase-like enzyme
VTARGETPVKLLIQPQDGIAPLVAAIKKAKKSVDIVIFRFDRAELEAGLKDAAERGVSVSALIAYANHGGEKSLRKLEMRLLEAGVTVSRTADDLSRYHDKLLIIDRRVLYVLSFNFTHLDIDHSRGFGIVTRKSKLVEEALKLLGADNDRTPYTAGLDTFVVSPINARKQLLALIRRARKQLLIYDPKVADAEMLRALNERAKKGVDIRLIGSLGRRSHHLKVHPLGGFRLHTRTIIRDRREAFVGSQSLRKAELDSRREVGVIVRDSKVVSALVNTFEADWGVKETAETIQATATPQELKKSLKEMVEKLSPLNPLVKEAVKEVVSKKGSASLNTKEVKATVEKAVKEAVRERVQEMLNESAEQ